jgi:hypothetical protein
MRTEFNNLKNELLDNNIDSRNWNTIYALLNLLDDKITEVEKRLIIVGKTSKEIESAIGKYTESVDSNEDFKMSVDHHDVILRGSHDIMIAIDLGDDEPINNDWYGIFDERNEQPTELCKTPQKEEIVKDIIDKLKSIDVDGETMQYIIEQVGMTDQMLRQLIMSKNSSDTIDLLKEKINLVV